MDNLGFKTTDQVPPKQKKYSKYTAFLDKVKRSKRVYVKKFDDKTKANRMASTIRTHIRSHHIKGIEVVIRGTELFVFNSDNREEEIDV